MDSPAILSLLNVMSVIVVLDSAQLQRHYFAAFKIGDPYRVVVGVGDVDLPSGDAQSAGFGELGLIPRAVPVARLPVAQQGEGASHHRQHLFDLVVIGIGQVDRAVVVSESDGVLQPDIVIGSVNVAELEMAKPDNRAHPTVGVKIGGADGAGFAVGEIKPVTIGCYAAGLGQSGAGQKAVV